MPKTSQKSSLSSYFTFKKLALVAIIAGTLGATLAWDQLSSNSSVLGVSIAQRNAGFTFGSLFSNSSRKASSNSATSTTKSTVTSTALDVTKLPLGDKKYSTTAKKGYVFSCSTTFTGGGASTAGPWINTTASTWNLTKKATVDGTVTWVNATWKVSSNGKTRTLSGNGLPIYHTTGTYPIAANDDAYKYDRNPHSISAQTISLSLPANPTLLTTPQCVGGEVGIMLSGVPIFNAFDAGGRDAMAWETQDSCDGHPQQSGQYHYHGYSDCIKDDAAAGEHSELIGYAFDGFGIYGLKGEGGVELSSADLDECHGHTSKITWDGKEVEMYHYHMTRDFPYSVSCFRGKAVVKQSSTSATGGSGMQRDTSGIKQRLR